MKKNLSLSLACLALGCCLVGCGNKAESTVSTTAATTAAQESQTIAVQETEAKKNKVEETKEETTEAAPEKGVIKNIHFGDKIVSDFVEMTVDGFSTSQELKPSDTSGVYSYKADNEDETYFYLNGTMKNISGDTYDVEDMVVQFTFDDKYNYDGYIAADEGGNDFHGNYVMPLKEIKYYMYASVPDELINSYSTCTATFAFHDDFDHDFETDFNEYEHCFSVNIPDDGEGGTVHTIERAGEKKEADKFSDVEFNVLNFGDSITNDFMEMTIQGASTTQELKPSDTSGVYSYKPDTKDETYFYVNGTLKNVAGDSYDVEDMIVQLTFDDTYNYTGYIAADEGGNDFYGNNVKPFKEVKLYIYSSVPDEIIETYSTCTVRFAFHDNFEHDFEDDFSVYENCYMITVDK